MMLDFIRNCRKTASVLTVSQPVKHQVVPYSVMGRSSAKVILTDPANNFMDQQLAKIRRLS